MRTYLVETGPWHGKRLVMRSSQGEWGEHEVQCVWVPKRHTRRTGYAWICTIKLFPPVILDGRSAGRIDLRHTAPITVVDHVGDGVGAGEVVCPSQAARVSFRSVGVSIPQRVERLFLGRISKAGPVNLEHSSPRFRDSEVHGCRLPLVNRDCANCSSSTWGSPDGCFQCAVRLIRRAESGRCIGFRGRLLLPKLVGYSAQIRRHCPLHPESIRDRTRHSREAECCPGCSF